MAIHAFYRTITLKVDVLVELDDTEDSNNSFEDEINVNPVDYKLRCRIVNEVEEGNFKVINIGNPVEAKHVRN